MEQREQTALDKAISKARKRHTKRVLAAVASHLVSLEACVIDEVFTKEEAAPWEARIRKMADSPETSTPYQMATLSNEFHEAVTIGATAMEGRKASPPKADNVTPLRTLN